MNRSAARQIAENITAEQLKETLLNAKRGINDWMQVSRINKGMTKGAAFNILSAAPIDDKMHIIAKTNIVREFGEFLPKQLLPTPKPKKEYKPSWHEEPKDLNF